MSKENENTNNKWRSREMGALWARKGKSQNYFSGYVSIGELGFEQRVKIVGFKNFFKDDEKQPDFRLYESEDQAERSSVAEGSSVADDKEVEGEDQELI